MKEIIEQAIDWENLTIEKVEKEKFKYEVGSAILNGSTLIFPITLNFIIPYRNIEEIKEGIKEKSGGKYQVEFEFNYKELVISTKDIIRLYIPHLVNDRLIGYAAFLKSINLSSFKYKDDTLVLKAFGETAAALLNKNVKVPFEEAFKNQFGIKLKIEFVNDEKAYEEKKKAFSLGESSDIKEKVEKQKERIKEHSIDSEKEEEKSNNKPYYRKKNIEEKAEGNHIIGKGIKGDVNRTLGEVYGELGRCIVEGQIFKITSRAIKTKDYIISLLITDKKTTVLCKAFLSEDKLNEVENLIPIGSYVKIQGDVQFDTFENMNVIMFKNLDKIDDPFEKIDTCEKKRVELHLHTNMSQMDGLTPVANAVRRAAIWGQKAIAITDHGVVQSFPDARKEKEKLKKEGKDIKVIYGLEGYVFDDSKVTDEDGVIHYKDCPTNHIILLAKNQEGIKDLYKLVSKSNIDYFYKKPRLPWSLIEKYRSNLVIGSACVYGEVYNSLIKSVHHSVKKGTIVSDALSNEEQEAIAKKYDYLEIQPVVNNKFLLDGEYYFEGRRIKTVDDIRDVNRRILEIGDKLGKKVVATTDSHYENEEDAIYRNIIMAGMGYEDAESGEGLYMKTTDEMLNEFSYLNERANEIVVDNTEYIASLIDDEILPVPKGKFPPKIKGAEEILRKTCMENAYKKYGNPLPKEVEDRLNIELNSIINNGYAVMYIAAKMLVDKSLSDGYLVGSRGSVGSSIVATFAGITEVNPLDPHYICPNCHHFEWGDKMVYDCGVDMPPKKCPECGTELNRDGYMIPFATFLGFNAEKEPDIDLNFAGEYQATAHKYVGEIFGEKNVYKAGTVSGIQDKTAFGFVKKYFEENDIQANKYEIDRLVVGCTGVKRTTGQHPGGIVVVPDDHEIYEFCPVQRPADKSDSDVVTTHFDYHKIDENLLKLDCLGHDVPTMIRQLQDMTGIDPLKIDLTDRKVLSIFNSNDALDIKDEEYKDPHGSFAVPEFGTRFTQQMLDDIKPNKFADLVRISGFSHGTDVWLNNAQDYIRSGIASMSEVISTRDDIMNYLMLKGLEPSDAFTIMEIVRKKNKVLTEDWIKLMKEHGVPEWYIDSCSKIQYMFPRAHAVAYTMMSFRMAWFKVYYPLEFYATYFTSKVNDFDADTILAGRESILKKIEQYEIPGSKLSKKDEDQKTILEVAREMFARGYTFLPPTLENSDATKFKVKDGKVLLPFMALEGVGENAARDLVHAYKESPFNTIEEASSRGGLNKTAVEALKAHGVFKDLPDTDQLSMF